MSLVQGMSLASNPKRNCNYFYYKAKGYVNFRYEEHLDRMKKRSSAAVDSCMLELRMTLMNINEMLQSKTEAKWRKRLWLTAYGKVELGMFAGLQLLNLTGFSMILHMWN